MTTPQPSTLLLLATSLRELRLEHDHLATGLVQLAKNYEQHQHTYKKHLDMTTQLIEKLADLEARLKRVEEKLAFE